MAVPFCLPDQNNEDAAGSSTASASQNASGASSTMQSPLQSPLSDAHFIQAFYEALYRCTQGGLPETPLMSPLMSPNPDNGCGYYGFTPNNGSRFYFPQSPRAPLSPHTPVTRHHPQYVQGRVPQTTYSHPAQRVYVPRRVRLSSMGEDELYEDVNRDCASVNQSDDESEEVSSIASSQGEVDRDDLMLHLRHMEAREQLQMFPGRVPPPKNAVRRKRNSHNNNESFCQSQPTASSSNCCNAHGDRNLSNISSSCNNKRRISMPDVKPKEKSKDSFKWPTVVTVVVIAVGCGILVSR
uniref:CSON007616 protein n=1 Tax=Culicoides sonorensis TaxID=179676 RepID=A0A336N6H7_CULSO